VLAHVRDAKARYSGAVWPGGKILSVVTAVGLQPAAGKLSAWTTRSVAWATPPAATTMLRAGSVGSRIAAEPIWLPPWPVTNETPG